MSNKLSVAEEFLVHYSATGHGGTTNKMVEPILKMNNFTFELLTLVITFTKIIF